jgi:hypothetical protein
MRGGAGIFGRRLIHMGITSAGRGGAGENLVSKYRLKTESRCSTVFTIALTMIASVVITSVSTQCVYSSSP